MLHSGVALLLQLSGRQTSHLAGNIHDSSKFTGVSSVQTTLNAPAVYQSMSKVVTTAQCIRLTSSAVMVVVLAEAGTPRHAIFFG